MNPCVVVVIVWLVIGAIIAGVAMHNAPERNDWD